MFEKSFITDCEGPLTLNDNAFELCAHFIDDGDELFKILSLYDDYLVDEVKKDIHTLEDLLNFLYDNDVAIDIDEDDDYTDWVDRVAVQELAKEICGIELGE